MANYYRPRMLLQLSVPTMGDRQARVLQEQSTESVDYAIKVRHAQLISNDHNHADELHVTVDWRDAGTDPRLIRNAVGIFHLSNSFDSHGTWEPTLGNAVFAGMLVRGKRSAGREEAMQVELEFLDYTTLFLEAKPFGVKGIPELSQTLSACWKRIVSQTPGAAVLADRLVFEGAAHDKVIGKGVASRFVSLAKLPVKPRTDAWAVWQQCIALTGWISYIRQDECVVTSATNYYSRGSPPRLIWGQNISTMSESRNPFAGKGIALTSLEPLSGRVIEGYWPPIGDASIRRKKVSAKKLGSQAAALQDEEREYFQWPIVTDLATLTEVAKRVFEERGKQEIEGSITTSEMVVEDLDGVRFDLLALRSGDDVRIEFDKKDKELLGEIPTEQGRVDYLVRRGYSPDAALILARNMSDLALLNPTFYVKRVATTIDTSADSPSYDVEIHYVNRILVKGDAETKSK